MTLNVGTSQVWSDHKWTDKLYLWNAVSFQLQQRAAANRGGFSCATSTRALSRTTLCCLQSQYSASLPFVIICKTKTSSQAQQISPSWSQRCHLDVHLYGALRNQCYKTIEKDVGRSWDLPSFVWNKCAALQPQQQHTFQNSPWQNSQEKLNQVPHKAAFGGRLLTSCVWRRIIFHGRERCNTHQKKLSLFLPDKFHAYAQIHQRMHLNKTVSSALKRLCLKK